MTNSTTDSTEELSAKELHERGRSLSRDDRVKLNDRARPLTVVGEHDRERKKKYSNTPGDYTVIELEGNGTEYHLLTWEEANHSPILYKEKDWEIEEAPGGGERYEYPRGGERIESLTIVE